MIEFLDPPEPGSAQAFSRATRAAGLIFVSGTTAPHDPDKGIVRADSAAEQVKSALLLIAGVLDNSGSSMDRIVQVTMLITNSADYAECNAEYIKHFPAGLPARQTVRFGVPTTAKVGFSCIALAT